jgi:hypothetical protein
MLRAAPLLCLAASASGCFVTYAPPVRGLHLGMPDRVGAGEIEIGAEAGMAGGLVAPLTGGAHVSNAVSDLLAVEGGANVDLALGMFATGWGGVRFVRRRALGHDVSVSGDLEFGGGAGIGGRDAAGTPWFTQGVVGLYDGAGLGLRWKMLGAFVRTRVDVGVGTSAPTTLWATWIAGLEAKLFERVVLAASAGAISFRNAASSSGLFFFAQFGFAALFDLTE